MHGYGEYSGYNQKYELIRHTVRKGSVVIYPRWQTSLVDPCPGPFDIEPCMASSVRGIRGALAYLGARPGRVQPRLDRASYFGFSFGGIITTNLANRWRSLNLPTPRAIFLDDPHDGGFLGPTEPAVDDSLAGIPRTAKLQCHSSAEGVISEPGKGNASCNAIYPKLWRIPRASKDLVLTRTDRHGTPPLLTPHGVCTARRGAADAYDWNFCWKVWDALRACAGAVTLPGFQAFTGRAAGAQSRSCRYALGTTREHRSNGRWSDGVPVIPLKVQDAAPIRP